MSHTSYAGLSDRGRVRETNEDRWFADPKQGIYIVADGMGGAAAGEVAADAVTKVLPRLLVQRLQGIETLDDPRALSRIQDAVGDVSNHLREEANRRPGFSGMGSTVVLAVIRGRRAVVAHMGDSRAYLLRGGNLEQLTKDHSIVQLLVDEGDITSEQAAGHAARGQITRFVGMRDDPLPEAQLVECEPGDRLVLCSDGLSNMVSDDRLLDVLNQQSEPERACKSLVESANEAGGKDNVTVLIVLPSEAPE